MSDRYARRPSDGEQVCRICGSLVSEQAMHDLYHDRIDRLTDMRVNRRGVAMVGGLILNDPPLTSITATDWQAAHDAGEDEELRVGEPLCCALCGHQAVVLGGSVTEPDGAHYDLCHGCEGRGVDEGHDCYHQWTVYGQRPHTDYCRDLYCGGCDEVDPPHVDPCDCDDCRTIVMHNYESDLPNEEEPRKCAVCGEPVRVTSDGHPYHYSARADIGDHHATLTPPEASVTECMTPDDPCADPHNCDSTECARERLHRTLRDEADQREGAHLPEPPVGAVVRCTGCGNVYIHKPDGWWNTDDGSVSPSLDGIKRPSCGPLRVIYTPGEDK